MWLDRTVTIDAEPAAIGSVFGNRCGQRGIIPPYAVKGGVGPQHQARGSGHADPDRGGLQDRFQDPVLRLRGLRRQFALGDVLLNTDEESMSILFEGIDVSGGDEGRSVLPPVAPFPRPGPVPLERCDDLADQALVLLRRKSVLYGHRLPDEFPGRVAEDRVLGGVRIDDDSLLIRDAHPFDHALQHQRVQFHGLLAAFALGDVPKVPGEADFSVNARRRD